MEDYQEVKEISQVICKCIYDCQILKGYVGADDMAKRLYKEGYRRVCGEVEQFDDIVDELQKEIEDYKFEIKALKIAQENLLNANKDLVRENKRIKEELKEPKSYIPIKLTIPKLNYNELKKEMEKPFSPISQIEYQIVDLEAFKQKIIKEFVEKLKEIHCEPTKKRQLELCINEVARQFGVIID